MHMRKSEESVKVHCSHGCMDIWYIEVCMYRYMVVSDPREAKAVVKFLELRCDED